MTTKPLVSVIIPTTHDRKSFNESILNQYILQNYQNKELIWDYEPGTIGEKRNRLCAKAEGEIIIHFDSDDRYASDWITKSIEAITENNSDITGLSTLNFYNEQTQEGYVYTWFNNPGRSFQPPPWVSGATMCYKRSFWERNPFRDIQVSEDSLFIHGSGQKEIKIAIHDYIDGFLASIHQGNTSPREVLSNRKYRRMSKSEEELIRKNFFAAEGSLAT